MPCSSSSLMGRYTQYQPLVNWDANCWGILGEWIIRAHHYNPTSILKLEKHTLPTNCEMNCLGSHHRYLFYMPATENLIEWFIQLCTYWQRQLPSHILFVPLQLCILSINLCYLPFSSQTVTQQLVVEALRILFFDEHEQSAKGDSNIAVPASLGIVQC